MHRLIVLALAIWVTLPLASQDKEASDILDRASNQLTGAETLQVLFELTITYPEEESITLSSKVVQSGKKFLFINKEQEYYGNGEDIWIYIPSHNEVQINDFEEDELEDYFITPLDLLSQYKSGKFESRISDQDGQDIYVELKPIDDYNEYSKLRLTIGRTTAEIKHVKAFSKDATVVEIEITDIKKNIPVKDELFQFDVSKYPGVHVEDLRLD
jgi:Outer membrane lipoprotein-sorting protein